MFQGMRYVYEVYKEMSFSKAARNLYISQPSLSAAVKKAEQEAGFPIFDRSTSPIRLTEPGREYIRALDMTLDVENGFQNYINDLNELRTGSISIGGTNLFVSFLLPPILSRFTARYPAGDIRLTEASTEELTEKLFSGQLDLMIDNSHMDPSVYEKEFVCEEHLVLTVPKAFPSAARAAAFSLTAQDIRKGRHLKEETAPVPLDFFRDDPFLFLKSGNDTRSRAERICHAAHFVPHIRLKLDQQITAYNLSSYGMGISFTGDVLINRVPVSESLVFFKLGDQEAARRVHFYYKRNRYLSRTVRAFLTCASDPSDLPQPSPGPSSSQ